MYTFQRIKLFLKRLITNTSPRLYNVLRFLRCLFDRREIRKHYTAGDQFVLVYQQGRVASTSVYESICALHLNMPVYHVHTLSEVSAREAIAARRRAGERVDRYLVLGDLLGHKVAEFRGSDGRQPWKIVTIFREPISTMLSLFFLRPQESFQSIIGTDGYLDPRDTLEHVRKIFVSDDPEGWSICNWYEAVFSKELGVDIYDYPFDSEDGWDILHTEKFEVLILRFEDLSDVFGPACAEFFGIAPRSVRLMTANLHRDERYSDVFEYVKRNLRLSEETCNRIYATKFVQHFYSPHAIRTLTTRWTRE